MVKSVILDRPTRWKGNREIDWGIGNFPQHCSTPVFHEICIGDHKLLDFRIEVPKLDLQIGSLAPTADFSRPDEVCTSVWRQALNDAWNNLGIVGSSFDGLTVQESWDLFMLSLDRMFRTALHSLDHQGLLSAESVKRVQRRCNAKGVVPGWRSRNWARSQNTWGKGSMKVVKIRKRLARLYEYKRLLTRPDGWDQHRVSVNSLAKKLDLPVGPGALPKLTQEISSTRLRLDEVERSTRNEVLKQWRERLRTDPKAVSRWLKSRDTCCVDIVKGADSTVHHPKDVASEIHRYWTRFWESNDSNHGRISQQLVEFAHVAPQPIQFDPPDLQLLVKTARSQCSGGAASVDGWHGDELRHLPESALGVFRHLALQWEQRQEIPNQFHYSRMVNLPKKTVNGELCVENIRPITILASFWRLWASSYMRTPGVVAWLSSSPSDIVAGKGSDSQLAASEVFGSCLLAGSRSSGPVAGRCLRPSRLSVWSGGFVGLDGVRSGPCSFGSWSFSRSDLHG